MRIGLMTSGGDCPGLNAVIRAAVLKGIKEYDAEIVGFKDGWRGVVEMDYVPLSRADVRGLAGSGGTILGTSRTNPVTHPGGGAENMIANFAEHGIDGLIAIGGEGTMSGANELAEAGVPVVGVPKTIDNDLDGTDYTFGFDTAVAIATDAMDRLRTTGDSHHRCMVAEVMGRHVGWIALHSGMSAGAHAILIPEQPESMQQVCDWVRQVHERGRSPLVVVAEGYIPQGHDGPIAIRGKQADGRPRLGGIGEWLAEQIEEMTGIETRNTTLGHIQRGGAPTGFDRVLATRCGMHAVQLCADKHWGQMTALRGTEIEHVSLSEATHTLKTVPLHRYEEAKVLFGR
ncbi:6-phosphofructokinase [Micrococcoides hystricis]|uniref:ATP-dependent 6-phosphofructokinase n=1 Tax=Micrococcoides hystricis TaxID=1572761 RepID=A0ABV6P8Z7_9MICC